MAYKMIMTTGYPEMTEMVNRIASEMHYDVTVVEGILDNAAHQVKELMSNGSYDAIISRAGTAKMLERMVDIPIIHNASSHFDFLQAFLRAKELGDKICIVTYPEEGFSFDFDELEKMLGFSIEILPYKTWKELVQQVKKAKEMGMEIVVGGGRKTAELVREYGMQSMHLKTSERTVKRALVRAYKAAENRQFLKEKAERLNALINVSEEGILFLNKDGKVEMFNPAAEKLFGIEASKVNGRKANDIKNEWLLELLQNKDIYRGKGSLTLKNMMVTYEPLLIDDARVGTVITFREFQEIQRLESQVRRKLYDKGLYARFSFNDIIRKNEKVESTIHLAKEYASTDSTVLLIGETGTGKELIAQSIHNESQRENGPFVAVNCAALPENLLESELFGYAEGAFTGAKKGGKPGLFELAHQGTIFLDEIGEIPKFIQARLLRVLQEKEVMRVGGDRVIPIDIRIVAATNRKLWNLVKEGEFRSDLYFRLSVLHLDIPPLRERHDDIPILADQIFQKLKSNLRWEDLSEELQSFFLSYQWPGNVRQLENILERLHLRMQTNLDEQMFIENISRETEDDSKRTIPDNAIIVEETTMKEMEKQIVAHMLNKYENKSKAAQKLGVSRTTLWKKINDEN